MVLGRMQKNLRRTFASGLGLVTAAALLAACGGDTDSSETTRTKTFEGVTIDDVKEDLAFDPKHLLEDETITVGAILPLSGAGTYYGDVQSKGIKLAAKLIKELGGPTLEIIEKDHKSGDPQAGVTAFRELNDDGVDIFMSTYVADFYALLPSFKDNNVFALEGGQQNLTPQVSGHPNYWSAAVSYDGNFSAILNYIKETDPSIKKLALIGVDYGEELRESVTETLPEAAERLGFDLVYEEYAPFGTTEFSTLIQGAQSEQPDAILNFMQPGAGLLARQLKQAGVTVPQYSAAFVTDDVKAGGSAFDGFTFSNLWLNVNAPASRYAQWFVDEWEKAYGAEPLKPDVFGSIAFEIGMQIWQLAMAADKEGLPINAESLNQVASTAEVASVFGGEEEEPGVLSWDPETHFPSGEIGVFEVTDGQLTQKARAGVENDAMTTFELLTD